MILRLLGLLLGLLLLNLFEGTAAADTTSLELRVESKDNRTQILVRNTGSSPLRNLRARVELLGKSQQVELTKSLAPGKSVRREFLVPIPPEPGTYLLRSLVLYKREGTEFSVLDLGYFRWQENSPLTHQCPRLALRFNSETTLTLPDGFDQVLLPPEFSLIKLAEGSFNISSERPGNRLNQKAYFVSESLPGSSRFCAFNLQSSGIEPKEKRILLSASALLALSGFLAYLFSDPRTSGLSRWGFSLFVAASLALLSVVLGGIADFVIIYLRRFIPFSEAEHVLYRTIESVLLWLQFSGPNHHYFFTWILPLLLFWLALPQFFLNMKRRESRADKYQELILFLKNLAPWSTQCRTAVLSLAVKAFFLPLVSSWSINQIGVLADYSITDLSSLLRFLIEALIFVDVSVFFLGYLTESPRLKNEIKSVEHTFLGWFVCLICYPPSNAFAFLLFDIPLTHSFQGFLPNSSGPVLLLTLMLWGIYTWASIALGFKASNLTNRGIVAHGPYRYVRHPAYAAKLSIWVLAGLSTAQYNFFLLLAFILVYSLRAWTEERHLSDDQDYIKYKQQVPWKLIPGVW